MCPTYAQTEVLARVQMDARQILDQWTVRIVAIGEDDDGNQTEPWVFQATFRTLDLVGPGWQACAILDEAYRRVRLALTDGYE